MRTRPLTEIARDVEGRVEGSGEVVVSGVSVDSRIPAPGSLFVALRGEHADGHAFVEQAFATGAAAAMVHSDASATSGPAVRVADTGRALLALARWERAASRAVVVGITGSNGKTSTKDLVAAVLATRMHTYASPGSFNNEVGVPLTILGAPEGTEALAIEMGARRLGDLALLTPVARPDVVVITNVGVAHMEIFGSWDAIVRSSAEPIEELSSSAVAILNADDPVVRELRSRTRARVLLFGTAADADVRAGAVRLDDRGNASFTLSVSDQHEPVTLAIPGEHMVSNALAAAAAGAALGITPAECAAGLKDAAVSHWRMETFTTAGGITVVNDAYNANPESVAAGLKAARWIARESRLIAVLGHMAELGPIALEEHERIGDLATRLRVDRLVAVGEQARAIAMAAVREGLDPEDIENVGTPEEAAEVVRSWVRPGDVVFLKGSRIVGLERVAEALR